MCFVLTITKHDLFRANQSSNLMGVILKKSAVTVYANSKPNQLNKFHISLCFVIIFASKCDTFLETGFGEHKPRFALTTTCATVRNFTGC